MSTVATVLVGVVALIHVYILLLEMFLWTTPRGRAAFGLDRDFARATRALAANQGLYNGFLAAGLIWGLLGPEHLRYAVQVFFLVCVIVAGLFGAATASGRILLVQAVPAAIALAALVVAQ
jgi:putative membrane protein